MPKKKTNQKNKKKQLVTKKQGFFAYPSNPCHLAEIIVNAIKELNLQSHDLEITSWEWMQRKSSRIISNILESIERNDLFIADISGLNPNVLFEAGIAFGKRKHSLLFTQGFSTTDRNDDLKNFEIIAGWDIGSYKNSKQLSTLIETKNPFIHKASPEYDKYSLMDVNFIPNRGLFLQGVCLHNIALISLKIFKETYSEVHIDDWNENSAQTLLWYVREINQASGIVAFFLPTSWDNSRAMNARYSFICGMAIGLGKKVKIIGLPEYEIPFDYKEIILLPNNEDQIGCMLREAFELSESSITTEQTLRPAIFGGNADKRKLLSQEKEYILLEVNLGDSIAENEEKELSNYFIKTGQFNQALKCRQALIIGCKGTGKTATFYQLRDAFTCKHVKNIVCEIKPADYKMARFLTSLSKLAEREGFVEHVLENVWKFILYCEIMVVLKKYIEKRPVETGRTRAEEDFLSFFTLHAVLVEAPFEQKLEIVSNWLEDVALNPDSFSKKIHDKMLKDGKKYITPIIQTTNKIVILIDNLDKSWHAESDLTLQAQLVFSLLGIHRRLRTDFGEDLDISVIIFLRRNILEYILNLEIVREPDKIITDQIELIWNDQEMLMRVIEERFRKVTIKNGTTPPEDIWTEFFAHKVKGVQTREWLYNNVLPRPRDLIHFVQKAIEWAINRGHSEIEEADMLIAHEYYSGFALKQIIAEYKAEQPWLENVINSFAGKADHWTLQELIKHIGENTNKTDEKDIRNMIADMVSVGFFGVKFPDQYVEYAVSIQKSLLITARVRDQALTNNMAFVINPVFCSHLKIFSGNNYEETFVHKRESGFLKSLFGKFNIQKW
ncbi:MAG: hypothetical protein H6Q66_1990 [Firmicutes bacterium]|nr:hypothetical protein [Bacillota bacterium]